MPVTNVKIKHILENLPNESGVYIMKNKADEIIYIGKAKNLKNRVSSYFNNTAKNLKTSLLVSNIDHLDYIIVKNEQDAFSLENNLIKEHKPKYNILLKDDKRFPYIKINRNEKFPQVLVVRKVLPDGADYFGPFVTGLRVNDLMSIIKLCFPIRTCRIDFSKSKFKKRPCLFGDLGKCVMPCLGKISTEEYDKIIDKVEEFLNGKHQAVKKILRKKMDECSEKQDYEHAIEYRNYIELLDNCNEKLLTSLTSADNFDGFAIREDRGSVCINRMACRQGKTIADTNTLVEVIENDLVETLENYLLQYYSENTLPTEVLTNVELSPNIAEILSAELGKKVVVRVPQIGTKKQIIEMCEKNANEYLDKNLELFNRKKNFNKQALEELAEILNLPELPYRMECYDISNISGVDSVSSMVVFEDGVPAKKEYRKFKIRTVEGPNDFASMKETLTRRLKNLKNNEKNFAKKPNLIVIDGGKGQLRYANEVVQELGFNIPIISLAKREEEVFTPYSSESVKLEESDPARRLLQQIRDEAHRFAITFHRGLHIKSTLNIK